MATGGASRGAGELRPREDPCVAQRLGLCTGDKHLSAGTEMLRGGRPNGPELCKVRPVANRQVLTYGIDVYEPLLVETGYSIAYNFAASGHFGFRLPPGAF